MVGPFRGVPYSFGAGLVGPVNVAGTVYECIRVERTLDARPVIPAGETIVLLLQDAPRRPPADRIVSP
jgi:hypothetical protein